MTGANGEMAEKEERRRVRQWLKRWGLFFRLHDLLFEIPQRNGRCMNKKEQGLGFLTVTTHDSYMWLESTTGV